jgi:glutathione S-transferase
VPILYDYELSADAYKARLLFSLLGVAYEKRPVDVFPGREHLSADLLELNPLGTVPILVDGDLVLGDPEAILCHLAERHDPARNWLPAAGAAHAETMAWLFFAARRLAAAEAARLQDMLQLPAGLRNPVGTARAAFRVLEQHLAQRSFVGHGFLVGDQPSIADIACFPHVALSVDFGMTLEDFPKLRAWTRRVRSLPGFIAMPGIPEFL